MVPESGLEPRPADDHHDVCVAARRQPGSILQLMSSRPVSGSVIVTPALQGQQPADVSSRWVTAVLESGHDGFQMGEGSCRHTFFRDS
ncbi:MAG: hypothetical protein PVG80_07950 [Gammaproteobacteria bacterium]